MNILEKYLNKRFGIVLGREKVSDVESIDTTASEIFRGNPNRAMWMIINLGADTIYIGFDGQISINRGIPLTAGGNITSWIDEDLYLTEKCVWGISSSGTCQIHAFEVEAIT